VVHRQHHIEFTRVIWRISRPHEDRVRRKRPLHIHAFGLRCRDRRGNDLDFLTPKMPPSPACGLSPATAMRGARPRLLLSA
jgi:hypothetical protein